MAKLLSNCLPTHCYRDPSDSPAVFLNAARAGDAKKLAECLRLGNVDINTANANGLTALHLAAKEGHLDVVNQLVQLGADINACSKKGNTPTHTAALAGKLNVVKALVAAGSNINAQSQLGFTPLYMAAQENHLDVIKFLLANNARQDLATEDGYTPLAVAVQQGHNRVVSLLIASSGEAAPKPKPDVVTPTSTIGGPTVPRDRASQKPPPLHIAARKDDVQAAEIILRNAVNNNQPSEGWAVIHETTKSGFTALHVASRYNHQRVASLLIEHGADVNFTAKNAVTALHVASKWGHPNMARLLLNLGAKTEARTGDDLTALHCAARNGHESVVVILLERGASVSARSRNGLAPLHMSVQGDHLECSVVLLKHGADINSTTADNLTPLHIASHYGHIRTAKLLVDSNCNINALAPNGFTPLHIACKKNHLKVVELLLRRGAQLESQTENGLTPLHVAAFMGNDVVVSFLLQNGADPNSVSERGETPLHLAARARRTPIMKQLVDHGAEVDAKSKDLTTALHMSSRLGDLEGVRLLLQRGASPNSVTADLNVPLHGAAREGHADVATLLIDSGANKTAINKRGFSPLHLAAKFKKLKVAKLLLDRGVSPNIEGKYNLTPLHVATHYGSTEIAFHLLDRQANPRCSAKNGYTPLHIASKRNRRDIADALLKHGADAKAESGNGYAPLHLAASGGHGDIAKLLLNNGANANCRSKNGLAPMHLCAQEDKVNVAEILEQHGAEIDPQTKAGYTPLHTACHFGQVNMIQFLLRRGASVHATTKMGYTPLHQAAQQGQVIVIKILLKNKADPNALTASGQTALSIAENLGLQSVIDVLKNITDVVVSPATKKRKFNMAVPELMQEAPMSDWEDEGHPALHTITEEMEPTDSMPRTPAGLQMTPRFGSADLPTDGDVGDMSPDGNWTLPAISKRKSREAAPPSDLQVSREPMQRWTWSDNGFDNLLPNGQDGFESTSMASLGPSQILDEMQYMKHDIGDESSAGSPRTPKTADDEFFLPRLRPVSEQLSEDDAMKPTLGAVIGRNGGIVVHPQKVRVIVPPGALTTPTKITCRLVSRDRVSHPPPLRQAESLASRIVEMGPPGLKFLKPVIIEVPHFASLRGGEREISVRRSDGGRMWKDAAQPSVQEIEKKKTVLDVLKAVNSEPKANEQIRWDRVSHIFTSDLPQYFAIVSRVNQQKELVGPSGATIKSTIDPGVSVTIPPGSLSTDTPVRLEVQPVPSELLSELMFPAASPVVTVEPEEGNFAKPVKVTMPCPPSEKGSKPPTKLRLIAGTTETAAGPTCWRDVTDAVPMSPTATGVSFTPDLAAIRFLILACPEENLPDKPEAGQLASSVHEEVSTAPFLAKFVVFGKRTGVEEGQLKVHCLVIHDDDICKLNDEEGFEEVARSGDVEVLEGKPQFIQIGGNLQPSAQSEPSSVIFRPFEKNFVPINVTILDLNKEPKCQLLFSSSPFKDISEEIPKPHTCTLSARLPDSVWPDKRRSTRQQMPAGDVEYLLPAANEPNTVEWPGFGEEPPDNALPVGVAYAAKELCRPMTPPDVEELMEAPVHVATAASAPPQHHRTVGDLQSRLKTTEDRFALPNGVSAKRQTVTKTFFRIVTDWPSPSSNFSRDSSDEKIPVEHEEIVGVEVDENIICLPPGSVEPFGRNTKADVTTETSTDELSNGAPVHRTVRTVNFRLVDEDARSKSVESPDGNQRPKSPVARMDALLKSFPAEVVPTSSFPEIAQEAGKNRRLGKMESRYEVQEGEQSRPDGSTIKHRRTITRQIAPVFEVTTIRGQQLEKQIGEQLLRTDIEEIVTKLPPGLLYPYGIDVETQISQENFTEKLPDGTDLHRKLVTVTAKQVSPYETDEWLQRIATPEKTAEVEISPGKVVPVTMMKKQPPVSEEENVSATVSEPASQAVVAQSSSSDNAPDNLDQLPLKMLLKGDTRAVTTVKESRRGTSDGGAIIHLVKTTQHIEPDNAVSDKGKAVDDGRPASKVLGVEIEEVIAKLPPGDIQWNGQNVNYKIGVQNAHGKASDETPVDKKVVVVDLQINPVKIMGDLQSRTVVSDQKSSKDDGTLVAKNIKTTEHFRPVTEICYKDGIETTRSEREEPVKYDVVENVLELHPGCVQPFGSNVVTEVTVKKTADSQINGVPAKKKVVKLEVTLKGKKSPAAVTSTKPTNLASVGDPISRETKANKGSPGSEFVEGPVTSRTEVTEDKPKRLDNGGTLKHKTVTVTHVKPVKEVSTVDGRPQVLATREEVVAKDIEESFLELPPGVTEQFGKNLESVTSIETPKPVVVNGVPITRKVNRTIVSKVNPKLASDEDVIKHINDGTMDEIVPLINAKVEGGIPIPSLISPTGTAGDVDGERQPDALEYHRCLDDGTVVRRIVTASKEPDPSAEPATATDSAPTATVEIDDNIFTLFPGTVEPNGENCDAAMSFNTFEKPVEDGPPLNVTVAKTEVLPNSKITRRVVTGPEQSRIHLSEDACNKSDGTKVIRNIRTTEYYNPVKEIVCTNEIETESPLPDEIVKLDVVENVVELHPGTVKPFASNVVTDVTIDRFDESTSSGIPLKRKVVKVSVTVKDKQHEQNARKEPVSNDLSSLPPGRHIVEEPVEFHTDMSLEKVQPLRNGGLAKQQTVTVTCVKPVKEVLVVNGRPVVLAAREEVVGKEINECSTELPPGVTEQYGPNLESLTTVENLGDSIINGVPIKRKKTKTVVNKVTAEQPTDDEILKRSKDGTLDEILPLVAQKTATQLPSQAAFVPPGEETKIRPEIVEYNRCLPDGSVVRCVAATTACPASPETGPVNEPPVAVEVDENVFTLPPGIIKPNCENCDAVMAVQNFEKPAPNGPPAKVTVTTVSLKPKEVEGLGDQLTRKAVPGDLQSRVSWSEGQLKTDDGVNVVTKVKTTEYFRVIDAPFAGKGSEPANNEETVRYEIVENVLELHPGCVEPFGSNVVTKVTVDRVDARLENGIPVKRKIVKLVVTMKPKLDAEGQDRVKVLPVSEKVAVLPEVPSAVKKVPARLFPGSEFIEGPVETRTEVVEESPRILENGETLRHQTVTVTHVKPIKEVAVVSGRPQVLAVREEILEKDIEESYVTLPPGVTEEFGKHLESVKTIEHHNDALVDGVLIKKTVSRTNVQQLGPHSPNDAEVLKHLEDGTLEEIIPILASKAEHSWSPDENSPALSRDGLSPNPDVVEYHRCLDDGTVLRRVVATTKHLVPDVQDSARAGEAPSEQPRIQVEVDENAFTLPIGLFEPAEESCDAALNVKNFTKPNDQGDLCKASVATAVVTPKEITSKVIKGDVQARTTSGEDKTDADNGTVVITKTNSKEFYQPVTELKYVDGEEVSSKAHDETIRFEIVQNVLELHPGCVEPYGSNVVTDVSIDNFDEVSPSGVPVKRKVVKLTVKLMEAVTEDETSEMKAPVEESTQPFSAPVAHSAPSSLLSEPEVIEGPVESRKEVTVHEPKLLDNGNTLKHKTTAVTHVKPFKKVANDKGQPVVTASGEKVIGREIEEDFVELPPGVEEQYGKNLESVTNVEHPADELIDGVPVKTTVKRTLVQEVKPNTPSDEDILQHVNDGTLEEIIPLVLSKTQSEPPVSFDKPDILEYGRCLDDGTVLRCVVATTKKMIPSEEEVVPSVCGDNEAPVAVSEPRVELQVDENVLALPPGLIQPQCENCDATLKVQNVDKMADDGTPVKKNISTAIISPKKPGDGKRKIEGPIEVKKQIEEDRSCLDDGTTIKRKVITTRRVRQVTEIVVQDGVETVSAAYEEVVGVDIEENILQLPAGVIEPSGTNCDTDITVSQNDNDHLSDGTPARRKIVKMVVTLKNPLPDKPEAVTKTVEGDIVERVDVKESERILPDGTIVKTTQTTTRRLKPITELTVADGVPTVTAYREDVVGADIQEDVVQLGPGVTAPIEDDPKVKVTHSEPKTSQTVLPDGTPAVVTTKMTSYRKDPEITYQSVEGAVQARTAVKEDRTSLPDKSSILTRTATTTLFKPIEVITLTNGIVTDTKHREEPVGIEIEERITELPPGFNDLAEPSLRTTTVVQNFDEIQPDGTPLKKRIIRITARKVDTKSKTTRKVRRIGPDGELIEDIIEEDEDGSSSRRSSISDNGNLLSPAMSPSSSLLELNSAAVFADVVELQPTVNTTVQEFEDAILPDSTAVRKRVVTTTEKRTIVMRALLPTDCTIEGEEVNEEQPVLRYTDVSQSEPEIVRNVSEKAETLPTGELVRRRVRTTGQRQLTTERTLITGPLDDERLKNMGLLTKEPAEEPLTAQKRPPTHASVPASSSGDEITSRLILRRHIHKKTIVHGDKEETLITETTQVEQDSDTPADLNASIQEVIEQFMLSDQVAGRQAAIEVRADNANVRQDSV